MIRSKTYLGTSGQNYIQASELAFAIIYIVKREGLQYDKYVSGSTNRTHVHSESEGKIYFTVPFAPGGEKVFVMFKSVTPTVGVCDPVFINSTTLYDAIVGNPYNYVMVLSGTSPFTLTGITKPSWSTVELFGTRFLRIAGTPTAIGTDNFSFVVGNCNGGGSVLVSENLNVLADTENLTISRTTLLAGITAITGIDYVVTSGALPFGLGAIHDGYTGVISVTVSNVIFPLSLVLYKNGVVQETLPVTANGTYNFSSNTYLNTDEINIQL